MSASSLYLYTLIVLALLSLDCRRIRRGIQLSSLLLKRLAGALNEVGGDKEEDREACKRTDGERKVL